MKAQHWSRIPETTAVYGIALLFWLYRMGGRTLFSIALGPVVFFYWLAAPAARKASRNYLQHAFQAGILSQSPHSWSSLRHLWRFADTILDKLLAFGGRFSAADLLVEGRKALVEDPRGAILVTAHTGCLELCQVIATSQSAHKLIILTHTQHSQRFSAILRRLNPGMEINHLEVSALTPVMSARLADEVDKGNYIVIAGDRTPIGSDSVCSVDFLGEAAKFPNGFALLATLLQCPLWCMICTRSTKTRARYRVRFDKLWEPSVVRRKDRREHLRSLCQQYADKLTENLGLSPYDWFNFYDFWHEDSLFTKNERKVPKSIEMKEKE